ncbi:MAG TPA: FAD-binding oxidoreductase [Gaiellaceae bacterium]|nr:FAD-binding oxidoreductase [Gaiellaceae bacterium]
MSARPPATADVVVVGGGVMGASVAFHLAARGAGAVVLLERDVVCSGATRHSTAIVRLHSTQPLLVRMAAHGLRVYRSFEQIVGSPSGFERTGMLFGADPRDREMLAGNVAVGRSEGAEMHLVDVEQVGEIDPRVIAEDLAWCYEPEAGSCDPYLVTAGFAAAAARSGAAVVEGVRVTGIARGRVATDAGPIDAGAVVVAAGAWSTALLAPLGYELPVRPARAEVARFRLPDGFGTPPPAVADFSPAQLYFRPAGPGFLEVGSLDPRHADEPLADPDDLPEGAERTTVEAYHDGLRRRLRGADHGHFRGGFSGVDDVTPDREPAIGLVPGAERVVVAAGFSGHGFKLAPAVGQAVAELVLDGRATSFDLTLLDPLRFARGELVGARYGYSVLG